MFCNSPCKHTHSIHLVLSSQVTHTGSQDVPNLLCRPCACKEALSLSGVFVGCVLLTELVNSEVSKLFDECSTMCVCVLLKKRAKKREGGKTSQLHGSHSASPPAIITTEPGRVNLHAQMHIDRSWGLGTGATSKPARCLFHQLGMKGQEKRD